MKSRTIIELTTDRNLFAPWFRDRESWRAWFVFLRALFALPIIDQQDVETYADCTGGCVVPGSPYSRAWLIVGRRGGKSFILALIAIYMACFVSWKRFLAPGERATIPIIARDRLQARIIFRYVAAMLKVPLLAKLVERKTAWSFDLNNDVTIEIHVSSFRSTRGYAIPCALLDEIAFWPSDPTSSDPDTEVVRALRPAMAQFPNPLLIAASSPYARRGVLFDAFKKHYGKDDDVLVWQAATRTMNPGIPQSVVDAAFAEDAADASAEYYAQFRSDLEAFVNRDAVMACVDRGCFERPPRPNLKFVGFVDCSGGGADSFTMAVSHRDGDQLFLDCVREVKPPFSPEAVCSEFSTVFKSYGIKRVCGDKYALNWPVEQFKKFGIVFEENAAPKSDIYLNTLPLINSGKVRLLDHPKMLHQIVSLERRTARSGKDSVDHPKGPYHDDLANAVCGSLVASGTRKPGLRYGVYQTTANGPPGRELDPKTGEPFEVPRRDPLAAGSHGCTPGKGLDPDASLFNAQRNTINISGRAQS